MALVLSCLAVWPCCSAFIWPFTVLPLVNVLLNCLVIVLPYGLVNILLYGLFLVLPYGLVNVLPYGPVIVLLYARL